MVTIEFVFFEMSKLLKDEHQPQSNDFKKNLINLLIYYFSEYAVDNGYLLIFICCYFLAQWFVNLKKKKKPVDTIKCV